MLRRRSSQRPGPARCGANEAAVTEPLSASSQVMSMPEEPATPPLVSRKRGTTSHRIWLVNLCLAAIASGLLALGRDLESPLSSPAVPWWALAIGFGLAEVFVIHLRFHRHAHSFSLSEIPLVVGLAFASPLATATAQAVGVGVALAAHRRQKPLRVAFNIAQRGLTTAGSILVFQMLIEWGGSSWLAVWGAAFAAMFLADILAGLLINLAISISENTHLVFDQVIGIGTALTFANTALALVAVMVMTEHVAALLLVMVPAAATFVAGNAFAAVQRKHDNLMALYASTRMAQRSLDLPTLLPAVLDHAREMFHAEMAEAVLLSESGQGPQLRTILSRDRSELLQPVELNLLEGVWARVASEQQGLLLSRPISNHRLAEYFASRGIRDAMVVPLAADDGLLGAMLIGNRVGDFSTFDEEDLKLLETLGNHVGVAVRNARLVRRLEESLVHETEMNKMKSDFVATISHELRTPLTNVQGYIKTLLRPELEISSTEQREFLERADRQSERLRRLIEDLLFASRIEASRPMPATDDVWVGDLVQRVLAERGPDLDSGHFVFECDPGLPTLRTSEEQLFRILSNLIDNALKHSPTGGSIVVTAGRQGEGIRISVTDQGQGIPAEEQERIFERFYQVDHSSTRRVGGAGMGLYICRQAAGSLGGRIWLERSDDTGSVFSLWLPLERPRNHVASHAAT
jgi:signal transduction histidine kinase